MINFNTFQEKTKEISILYVEDNDELRELFVSYFEKLFTKIKACKDGLEGLTAYMAYKYDIVITDINMPNMDGLAMSKKIKQIDEYQHIIIVSAYNDISNYSEAIKIGIDGYILKPIDYEQVNITLYKTVTQIFNKKENEEYKKNLEKLVFLKTEELRKQYITDRLTGLYNRIYLDEKLGEKESSKTLILLNIDNFSMINYNYGFSFGDKAIKEVSFILKEFQDCDFTLYRLQGDEFVLFANKEIKKSAIEISKKIKNYFEKKQLQIDELLLNISFTIAIDYGTNKDLLRTSSLTIQDIRQTSKNSIGVYKENSEFESMQKENLFWIGKIRDILNKNDLVVHFQAIKNIKKNKILKYEALARIVTDDDEIIMPNKFLKPTKLAGLTSRLTRVVIDKSFQAIKDTKIKISINITEQDLKEEYLFDYLEEKRKQYNIESSQIILEILESISVNGTVETLELLQKLKQKGYKIAIDDFGTENSNFSRLLTLNVDYIKIDGSFIKNLDEDKNSQEIVKAIVEFAHNIKCKVIAEFVHNEKIYEKLKEFNIDYAQGYYISKPKSYFLEDKKVKE